MSDRGLYRIIARREFVERARDRSFLISTAITLLILVGFIVAGAFLNKGTSFDLGLVGDASRPLGQRSAAAAHALGIEIRLREFADEHAATAAVRSGGIDAALVDAARVIVKSDPPPELIGVVQAVSLRDRSQMALLAAGLTSDEVDAALNQPPLPIEQLEPLDARRRQDSTVALVGVLALYGQLFAYGYWVAAGVVEEKSSRVIEVLLATVRPSHLLRGKILGIGVLGLCQLFTIGVVGLTTAKLVGSLHFTSGALATIGIVLGWFVIGFFFYGTLFSVAGAIVSRQEDLQSTMTPLSLIIVASLFIGIGAIQDPSSTLATVASLLPPSAPLVMPSRTILGQVGLWQQLLSIGVSVGATVAIIPIATKVYSRAVLRPGRVKIRQVLRGDRTTA